MPNYKLIDLKIGEIDGNKFSGYNIVKDDEGKFALYRPPKTKSAIILFILIFGCVGPILTLFFHKRCFGWFNKKIHDEYISPLTYKNLNNNIISRIILFIVSLLISFNTPLLILHKVIENIQGSDEDYDWDGLYKSLKKNGYTPQKFKEGYIQVEKFKSRYMCKDGNHRLFLLSHLYDKNKSIKVQMWGRTYQY